VCRVIAYSTTERLKKPRPFKKTKKNRSFRFEGEGEEGLYRSGGLREGTTAVSFVILEDPNV
jgi:hypothetical protein